MLTLNEKYRRINNYKKLVSIVKMLIININAYNNKISMWLKRYMIIMISKINYDTYYKI